MLFFTPEELKRQGISCKDTSQITFQKKLFTRAVDFSRKYRQASIRFCQDYVNSGLLCLIVENRTYFTVWLEKKEVKLIDEKEKLLRSFAKPKSTHSSSKVEAKSYDLVQRSFKSRGYTDNQSSTYHNPPYHPEPPSYKELFSQLPSDYQPPSDPLIPSKDIAKSNTLPPSNSNINYPENPKKRKRKYRGISY